MIDLLYQICVCVCMFVCVQGMPCTCMIMYGRTLFFVISFLNLIPFFLLMYILTFFVMHYDWPFLKDGHTIYGFSVIFCPTA